MTGRPYISWFPISPVLKKYDCDLNAGMLSGLPVRAGTLSPMHSSVCSARHKVPGMPPVCQSSRRSPALPGWLNLQYYLACSGHVCFILQHQHVLSYRQPKCATRTWNTYFLHLSTSGGEYWMKSWLYQSKKHCQ